MSEDKLFRESNVELEDDMNTFIKSFFLISFMLLMFFQPLDAYQTPWNQEFVVVYTPSSNYSKLYSDGLTDDSGSFSIEYNIQLGIQPRIAYLYFGFGIVWNRGESLISLEDSEYARRKTLFPDGGNGNWWIYPSTYDFMFNYTLVKPLITDYTSIYLRMAGGVGGGTLFQNLDETSSNIFFTNEPYGDVTFAPVFSLEGGFILRIPFLDGQGFPDYPLFVRARYSNILLGKSDIEGADLFSNKLNFSNTQFSGGLRFQF